MVRIGHASIDENGKAKGGVSGDQTGKEVCIREWYSKPWSVMLRYPSSAVANKMADACEAGCKNDNIGYDQNQRNTLHDEAKKVNYDLSKVDKCETDCSEYMTICAIAGGVTALEYTGNAPTTSTMQNAFEKAGFVSYVSSDYLTNTKQLRRGDILLAPGKHTVMVLDNGSEQTESNNVILNEMIDISHWQGTVDFNKVANSGVKYLFMKCSQFQAADSNFDFYYSSAKGKFQGLGCYIYNKVNNLTSAKLEAEFAVKKLVGKDMNCGVWLDMEDASMRTLNKKLLTDIIETEAEILQKAGYKVGIYCNYSWYNTVLDSAYLSKKYPFWIARYASDGSYKESLSPKSLNNCVIWQYSSKGSVPGINGNVDMNIVYTDLKALSNNNNSQSNTNVTTTIPLKVTSNIRSVQEFLNRYYKQGLKVDGDFGPKTKAAIASAFQIELEKSVKGLAIDGDFGSNSQAAFTKVVGTLKNGSKGIYVTLWQCLLVCLGYNPNGIDGDFGNGCTAATNQLLKAKGLVADSNVSGSDINAII